MSAPLDHAREEARALYAALVEEARTSQVPAGPLSLPTGQRLLKSCTPDVQGALMEFACEEIRASTGGGFGYSRQRIATDTLQALLRRRVTIPPHRTAAILDVCTSIGHSYHYWMPVASLLRLVSTPPTAREIESLERLRDEMARSTYRDPIKITERIDAMLAGDRSLLPGGAWSARVLADIAAIDPLRRDAWCELVTHLVTSGQAEPSRKWEKALHTHLDAVGRPEFVARTLEWFAAGPVPEGAPEMLVPDRDADYLKGFVWALNAYHDTAVMRALTALAEACLKKIPNYGAVSQRVGNACIRVLARSSGMEPIAQLVRLQIRVKYAVGLQLVQKALADAAARAGISAEELEEIAVPTGDLDRKEMRRQLLAQTARIERRLESDRSMSLEQWRQRYSEQPLIGQIARRLIWRFSEGSHVALGALPPVGQDGRLVNANDEPIEWVSAETIVHAWHPLGENPELVQSWRQWLDRHAIVQPFKQAHREVYILTDAERGTATYSNRFAAHILRQHQFAALCRERGWQYRLQGDWDSANNAVRHLTRWDLRMEFEIDGPPDRATGLANTGVFQFIATGQVRFFRGLTSVPLEQVPPLAFSEGMRDVDLFVGVCSVGNDPAWSTREEAPYGDYWRNYSFGELSESDVTRRTVLEGLLPRLKIADRVSFEERFLVVRGDLATYKIHLRSGNVLMEPGSRYLCIVAAPSSSSSMRNVYLPFEGDRVLSLILSKAFLLAADKKITDPVILNQLPPR